MQILAHGNLYSGVLLRVLPGPFPFATLVLRPPSEDWLRNKIVAWCVIASFYAFLNLVLSPQLFRFYLRSLY